MRELSYITKDGYIAKQSNELHIPFPFRELMAREPNTGASSSCSHRIENGNAWICK